MKKIRVLRYALLLSVFLILASVSTSLKVEPALVGVIKPASAYVPIPIPTTRGHNITAVYYAAYIYNDHDGGIADLYWKFFLYSDGEWTTPSYGLPGVGYCDFDPDLSRKWFVTTWKLLWPPPSGITSFTLRAEKWNLYLNGVIFEYRLDYYSETTVDVDVLHTSGNTWIWGWSDFGDVRHYYRYFVENDAPTANPISSRYVGVGVPVSFTGSGNDPENDPLSYEWNFGDGTTSTEQNPTHTYTTMGTRILTFRVKDSLGAYSSWQTANITVTKVIIDQAPVSDSRVDVDSTQTINFHAKWAHDNTNIAGGNIYVNGTKYVTDANGWIAFDQMYNTVGKRTWTITQVDCNGVTLYQETATDPFIIWDKVQVQLSFEDDYISVGDTAKVILTATYQSDGAPFTGTVTLNDTLNKDVVGKYSYTVASISDPTYGISAFDSNSVNCIFDKVTITLSVSSERIDVGSKADITWIGVYQYPNVEDYDGIIKLNDTLTKSEDGEYFYTVKSIGGDSHNITAFESNTVHVIFAHPVDTDGDGIPDITDPDDDNDGMPDTWEIANGLNPLNAADASLDPDGDGFTNLQEYQNGTNPNVSDAAAAFPLWIIGAVAAVLIGIAISATVIWKKRKQPPPSTHADGKSAPAGI